MDEDRRIRFIIAPLLLIASLGWGMWLDPNWKIQIYGALHAQNVVTLAGQAIALVASGGIVILASGVVIGTTSFVALRTGFLCLSRRRPRQTHEGFVSPEMLGKIWAEVGASGEPDPTKYFFVTASFDHGVLQKRNPGVHNWIVRRWHSFNISVTSIAALLYSAVILLLIHIKWSPYWCVPVAIFAISFLANAIWAWRDTMGMLEFQSTLLESPIEK